MIDDSDIVLFDGDNDQDATIGETTVRCIIVHGHDVAQGGSPVSPTIGAHVRILLRKSEVTTIAKNDIIVTDSIAYDVKDVVNSGSLWRIIATADQRRGR